MSTPLKLTSSGAYGQFSSTDVVPTNNGGMPLGGAAGQVPSKASIADHDWTWSDLPGAEVTITPAALAADELDYFPTDFDICSIVRISGDTSIRAILGFQYSGRPIRFRNVGSNPVVFVGRHPNNTPTNWIDLREDLILLPGDEVLFNYDEIEEFWYPDKMPFVNNSSFVFFHTAYLASVTVADYSNLNSGVFAVGTIAFLTPTATLPAGLILRTHINTTLSGATIWLLKNSNIVWFFGSGQLEAEALVSIPVLSNATNRFTCGLQLRPTTNGGTFYINNCLSIDYDHAINGGKWMLFSQSNIGATSTADSGVTVEAGKLYHLKIIINKARTEARYYINGVMRGIVNTNMPNAVGAGARVVILRNGAGTIVREIYAHSIAARAIFAY